MDSLLALVMSGLIFTGVLSAEPVPAQPVKIPAGRFLPLFGVAPGQLDFPVAAFALDRYPVTYRQYQTFIKAAPEWRAKNILPLYADERYLNDWHGLNYPKGKGDSPVVNIPWFAATAYCEARHGRLPTVLEWEYVAAASTSKANASKDADFVQEILSWYSKPVPASGIRKLGSRAPNFYGVYDMHGLVWEWTADFNSVFINGDNRQDGDKSSSLVCGSGATGSSSRENYAAFMRYAMRSSLRASFSQANVGFRCAY